MIKIYSNTNFGEGAGSSDGFGNWGCQGGHNSETRWKMKYDRVFANIDVCESPEEGQLVALMSYGPHEPLSVLY